MTDPTLLARLGGRKFLICAASLIGVHIALATSLITATIYRDLMLGIAAVYIAGNVTQKATAKTPTDGAQVAELSTVNKTA